MVNIGEFFEDKSRISIWSNGSDGRFLGVRVREVDIVPLLVIFISNLNGFVDIGISRFEIISTELDLHTIGLPWPLEAS
jgi:hypothetical protein